MKYLFDGTYYGWLTAVFTAFEYKEWEIEINFAGKNGIDNNLFVAHRLIDTDTTKANRVLKGLEKIIGKSKTLDFYRAFLSEDENAWNAALKIIIAIFRGKHDILENFGDPNVLYFHQTLKKVSRERHRMKAFIRFSKSNDNLYFCIIEPDFNVLPLIIEFFKNRYADQEWLIYDIKRNYGMLYNLKQVIEVHQTPNETAALSSNTTIELDEKDLHYQNLWKRYYTSTNIEARKNLKLHLQHVPKRYWKYLVEKQ